MTADPTGRAWQLPDLVGTRLTSNQRPHWSTRARITAEWRALAATQARSARIPPLDRALIVVHWIPATRHRHDPCNAYPMIKASVDGIVDAGVLPDDDAAHLDGPDMRLGPVTPVGPRMRGYATLRIVIVELAPDTTCAVLTEPLLPPAARG